MRARVWFKGCLRCEGDLTLEYDKYGAFISCLHCGAVSYDRPTPAMALATCCVERCVA